jgi:hypothetical protein
MGLNPFRPHRTTPADYLFVIAGVLVVIALIIWALFA